MLRFALDFDDLIEQNQMTNLYHSRLNLPAGEMGKTKTQLRGLKCHP